MSDRFWIARWYLAVLGGNFRRDLMRDRFWIACSYLAVIEVKRQEFVSLGVLCSSVDTFFFLYFFHLRVSLLSLPHSETCACCYYVPMCRWTCLQILTHKISCCSVLKMFFQILIWASYVLVFCKKGVITRHFAWRCF